MCELGFACGVNVGITLHLDAQLKWDLVVAKGGCKHLRGAVDEKYEAVFESCETLSCGRERSSM